MGDFVGVDPERVRKLANRLKDLEATLARHGPSIRKKFREWDSNLDVSLISKQTHAVGDDARDMAKRADLARNLEEHSGHIALCTTDGNLVNIPWDMKDVKAQSANEAKQEAQTLKTALDELPHIDVTPLNSGLDGDRDSELERINKLVDGKKKSLTDIKAIAQSLADHKDDPAYLAAFADAGGVREAARIGRVLHQRDGTHGGQVLSDDSKKLIGEYAHGIAPIFDLPKTSKNSQNPAALKSLTHPPGGDMWSVGALFKYGPSGDIWNPKTLSDVGGAMLDWRRRQKVMRYDYAKPTPPYSDGGFDGVDGGWYESLGLDLSGSDEDDAKSVEAIRANDPATAVISRVGQNAEASRDLLGSNTAASKRYASDLLDYKWQTPGPKTLDDSDAPRRVLTLAATDRSPEHRDQSGQAADNIFTAAVAMKDKFDRRGDFEAEEYERYPTGTAIALATITGTYAPDIGGTSKSAKTGAHGYANHALATNETDITKVMELFADKNPKAAGAFDGTLHSQISHTIAGKHDVMTDVGFLGNTAGLFARARANVRYSSAQRKDEEHTKQLFVVNTVAGLVGGVPGPQAEEMEKVARGMVWAQMMLSGGRAALTDQFSVDNAAKQEKRTQNDMKDEYRSYAPSIVEGLINAGDLPTPEGQPWYNAATGQVSPAAYDTDDFLTWWMEHEKHGHGLQDHFQASFDHSTR
ncbi:hypothetical protein [Streptomyces natalensis]|uniref:AG2 protein n=1 Tax=Streptomyces natalensis ATCC 27448 TaxID=1240678 RepID=A0A0D7CGN7_9ACTN|nr:hypothetical protein [Streptomyces natalensis]KIZ15429.1 hypothetical protein SNA_28165 [Streptomyces natalensis ATCC 27448]